MSRFDTLRDWLAWQETLHPDPIDLGLERVAAVARALEQPAGNTVYVTVAGTNGKGSSVSMLEAVYRAAGYRTGVYTSPHLLEYNERIRIDGEPVDDAALCAAFARIDTARHDITLTYFEFGTLAALEIFHLQQPDIVLLEVGMGGRLDAVNIVDADVALVTSISIDHSAWLGDDRESIGREKAGIFRAGRPAVCADPDPPASLAQVAHAVAADWYALGEQFTYSRQADSWAWRTAGRDLEQLPFPGIAGDFQLDNAAGVLMTIDRLQSRLPVAQSDLADGLQAARLPGRCQVIPGDVELVLDVAHNPESIRQLAAFLASRPHTGATWLVLGMLADKDVRAVIDVLADHADHWCFASLPGERGLAAAALAGLAGDGIEALQFDTIEAALAHAQTSATPGDRIVVTGSFLSVASAMKTRV